MSPDFRMPVVALPNGDEQALEDYEILDGGALHIEPRQGDEQVLSPTAWESIFDR